MQEAHSVVRERPGRALRLFFRVPVLLYHGPLAELFRSRCVMLLTTVGRKSGRLRTVGVSFMTLDGHYVAFAGWGAHADWYRNLLADPEVGIQVGRRRIRATARPVQDPARQRELLLRMRDRSESCGPPRPLRGLLARSGIFDYDREIAWAVDQAGDLPVVEIVPHRARDAKEPS